MTAQANTTRAREITTTGNSASVATLRAPRTAAERVCANNCITVRVHTWRIELPPKEQLAFLAGLGLLAVIDLISWPVAVAMAIGHELVRARHSKVLREFGQALEEA